VKPGTSKRRVSDGAMFGSTSSFKTKAVPGWQHAKSGHPEQTLSFEGGTQVFLFDKNPQNEWSESDP